MAAKLRDFKFGDIKRTTRLVGYKNTRNEQFF
jgi:hypothetical protein